MKNTIPSSPGRGQYAKSADVRRRILEACTDAFGTAGFHGASMADIARRAGISHTGLLHHFPRKEDLLIAVLELRDSRGANYLATTNGIDPSEHPYEALEGMLAIVVDSAAQAGLVQLSAVLAGEAASQDHPAHEFFLSRSAAARRFYTRVFTALSERGELRTEREPEVLATMMIALISGLQSQWLFDRSSGTLESTLRSFLATVTHGFTP